MNQSETGQEDLSVYCPFKWKQMEVLIQNILQDCQF